MRWGVFRKPGTDSEFPEKRRKFDVSPQFASPPTQGDDGGAPASGFRRCVVKLRHKRRAREHGADHFALHADAASVDDAQRAKAQAVRFDEVFFHNRAYVAGRNGVQVEHIGDGNADGFVVLVLHKAQK